MQSALQPVKVWIWMVLGKAGIGRRVSLFQSRTRAGSPGRSM